LVPAGFPLPLRNALAALSIAALDADDASAAVEWLAAQQGPPSPAAGPRMSALHLIETGGETLLAVHAPHRDAVRAHATRAARAAAAHRARPAPGDTGPIERAIRHAIVLWNEQLFFEVHEVLEEVWRNATGDTRTALQGLIQIAVAFHHLAYGNRRGARTLLAEGRTRLAACPPHTLPAINAAGVLADTAPWDTALARGGTAPGSDPPRLPPAR
jgi:hypothetical protein